MAKGIVKIGGKNYKTVALRVGEFRAEYPMADGWGILTELVSQDSERVICKATVTKDGKPLATGFAEERRGSSNINKTSALENCETSAIGRCLAAAGLAGEEYASADEVAQAIAQQNAPKPSQLDIIKAWGAKHFEIVKGMGFDGEWGEAKTLSEYEALKIKIKDAHEAWQDQQTKQGED